MGALFMYKFKVYDNINLKLKIYFISPDNSHIYLSIDSVSKDKSYLCELGELYLDEKKLIIFEDTPNEIFTINSIDNKVYKRYHDQLPLWSNCLITNLIHTYGNKNDINLIL